MSGIVIQINTSAGGLPKTPALSPAQVDVLGVAGDVQRNRKYHGGPQQALLLIAAEVIDRLIAEGWPLFYGALGENLTTYGLDHTLWRVGQRYRAGSVLLELTKPRMPCVQLNRYGSGIQRRIFDRRVKALDHQSAHWGESGFYASVLRPGIITLNDSIEPATE